MTATLPANEVTETETEAPAEVTETETEPVDKKIVNMYWTASRLRGILPTTINVDNAIKKFVELAGSPVVVKRVTRRLCVDLVSAFNNTDFNVSVWHEIAKNSLSDEGQRVFTERATAISDAATTVTALRVARIEAAQARDYVRWLEQHQESAPNYTDEQHTQLRETNAAYLEQLKTTINSSQADLARLFVELAGKYTIETLRTKPKAIKLAEGEVLVTAETLRKLSSCPPYIKKFQELFPDGTVINEEICVKHADAFDWYWAADRMLAPGMLGDWERATDTEQRDLVVDGVTTEQRLGDAEREFNRRLTQLREYHNSGLITTETLSKKSHELENRRMEIYRERDQQYVIIKARTFAKMYADRPLPRLADLAF